MKFGRPGSSLDPTESLRTGLQRTSSASLNRIQIPNQVMARKHLTTGGHQIGASTAAAPWVASAILSKVPRCLNSFVNIYSF